MRDCSYILFERLLKQYPYQPGNPIDTDAASRLEAARTNLKQIPSEYRHDLFELTDSLDILSYHKAHHAFLLGLDLGLSMSRILERFQEEKPLIPQ